MDIDITTLPERALSIRQPWAWAILSAGKIIENRPRRSHYRGPICIHASGNDSHKLWLAANLEIEKITGEPTYHGHKYHGLKRGGIIGTAEIVDCVDTSDSPWFTGPFGLVLKNIQPVEFIQVKGTLGLFKWRRNLIEESRP